MRNLSPEQDIAYLKDMLLYIDRALAVVPTANKYGVPLDDDMVISSIAMNLGQIGEQLGEGKLSVQTKERFKNYIEWRKIKDFRNFISKFYLPQLWYG